MLRKTNQTTKTIYSIIPRINRCRQTSSNIHMSYSTFKSRRVTTTRAHMHRPSRQFQGSEPTESIVHELVESILDQIDALSESVRIASPIQANCRPQLTAWITACQQVAIYFTIATTCQRALHFWMLRLMTPAMIICSPFEKLNEHISIFQVAT